MKPLQTRRSAIGTSLAIATSLIAPISAMASTGSMGHSRKPRRPRPKITEERMRDLGLYFPTTAYTSATAPNRIARAVLSGLTPGLRPAPFLERIEQNFARMDTARAARFMTTLQDRELTLLAQSYANACAVRTNHSPKLYDLMALQFTPAQLGRLSRHFGFAPLYEAVNRSIPHKGFDFQLNSNPSFIAPAPNQNAYSGNIALPVNNAGTPPLGPLAPYIGWADSTPYDIYLTFRTSPALGLLSVSSSLTATVAVYGIAANLAWGIGWGIGTPLGQFIQWVSPSLWDDIGGTINQIFENWGIDLSSAPNEDAQVAYTGVAEAAIADAFAMPVPEQSFLQETGGDYGSFAPWSYDTFDYPDYSWDSVANQFGSYGAPNYCEYCAWP